jgi:hypothetical protein
MDAVLIHSALRQDLGVERARERVEGALGQIWPFIAPEEEDTKGRKMAIQMRRNEWMREKYETECVPCT